MLVAHDLRSTKVCITNKGLIMDAYAKAKEKMAVIFNQAPWLRTDDNAVHMAIIGLDKEHQLAWSELYALYREGDNH